MFGMSLLLLVLGLSPRSCAICKVPYLSRALVFVTSHNDITET